ncbi:MAG: hypothetical protein IMF09_12735 [Proteobacteria bacterium]|nr:hypothetical protein [Pseudomonadota bacterium]
MHTQKSTAPENNIQQNQLIASYQASCDANNADQLATAIAWEQTVEIIPEAVRHQRVLDEFVGRVVSVTHNKGVATIKIAYNPALVCGRVSALFNLVYGNVSMYPDVRLVDLQVPAGLADEIGGPAFGIEGIRQLTQTRRQPLLATAIKPRGTPHSALADIAGQFASAGGHIIKDDQNLIETDLIDFTDRVSRCQQAIINANQSRGNHCVYFPHISGSHEEMSEQLEVCKSLDIKAVLTCPLITGMDTSKALCREYGMAHMGHPAMSGAFTHARQQGIDASVLLGTIYRLAGVDISIFPGSGGRLSLAPSITGKIRHRLQQKLGSIRPVLTCPAGGKSLQTMPELIPQFGNDAVYLVGGALLAHPGGIETATAEYLKAMNP